MFKTKKGESLEYKPPYKSFPFWLMIIGLLSRDDIFVGYHQLTVLDTFNHSNNSF